MRWMIPLLAILGAASPAAAQSVFPLPIPTRPTTSILCDVIEWGGYNFGQTAVPAGLVDVVQVSAGGDHTAALKSDGTVVAWRSNNFGQTAVPAGLVDVVQVSAGGAHTVALKMNGTVAAWGRNNYGQTTVPAGLVDVVQVSAGNSHTVALKSDGTVVAWGRSDYGQTAVPAGLVDVVQVAAGWGHTVALKKNGTVVAWGWNVYDQAAVPAGLVDVVQVSAGDSHNVALKRNGTVVAWGWNVYDQAAVPAGLVDVVQVSAGNSHTVALKSDGTVVAWGGNWADQTAVPAGLVDVVQVDAGNVHTVASKVTVLTGAATKRPFNPATVANWSAGGTAWSVDTSVTHDGVDSVRARTTDGQSTHRECTLTGPAVVDFWWKVSSEQIYDTFSYSLNGVNQQTISGEVDWTYRTLTLPEGTHTIRWTYTKDASDAVGQDAGWLDDFAVYPATATLQVRDGATVLSGTTTVDFGSALLGSAGLTKTLTFANDGFVPLEAQLSLPEGSPFKFDGGAATYGLLIGRGESVSVPITLSTSVRGTKTAQLTISAPDSSTTPPQITLTGDVMGPVIGVSAGGSPVTSGQSINMGLAPRTLQFTISNTGNVGNLEIAAISSTGNFQITQQPQATIAPQASTAFTVLAQATAFGNQVGGISITSNDPDAPTFTIPLTAKSFAIGGEGIRSDSMSTSGTGGAVGWDFLGVHGESSGEPLPSEQTSRALKSGTTPNNGSSTLEFTTQTAGVISWTWSVSAQEEFDWLLCEVDGQEVAGISTKNGVWQTQIAQVPAGANVRWVYRKDASGSAGYDAGYLADVEFRSLAANQSFSQWAQTNGIYDPQQRIPESGVQAMFAWLGRFGPSDPDGDNRDDIVAASYQPIHASGRLTYRYPVSKTADGTQQILYSSDMTSWTTRRINQRIVSEDADRMVIEATAPSGTKGFFKVVGGGYTSGIMVMVQGGALPQISGLAGTAVATLWIGKTEVTWNEWQRVRTWAVSNGYSDLAGVGSGRSEDHPVENVSWFDVAKWCNAKSEREGLTPVYLVDGAVYRTGQSDAAVASGANGYRLLTEAEWEWAARGGVRSQGYTYSGSNDVNAVAWHANNSNFSQPVGTKLANELGIHDMSGNVDEWCDSLVSSPYRPLRGGPHYLEAYFCEVGQRSRGLVPMGGGWGIGFRVARNAED